MPAREATSSSASGSVPAGPLGEAVLAWLRDRLSAGGVHRPTCKRLALLVAGLLETATVRRGDLTAAVARLHLSAAQEPSIARRLERLLDDPQLDPERIVPLLLSEVVATLLAAVRQEHASHAGGDAQAHARWYPLTLIVDETTVCDSVHVLAVGLAYQGIAVPLGVRTWRQNVPLAPGDYWCHVQALLTQVHAALPAELREHVVLVADRAYGVPHMLDLVQAFGWAWVLRLQRTTHLRLRDGRVIPAAALVPRPGTTTHQRGTLDDGADPAVPVAAFRKAGWRPCQVLGVWAEDAAEPWLLATNLVANRAECLLYARRWAIERLFLCWKSHGWDLELLQRPTPARLGRLLTGMVLATWWVLAIGIAHTTTLFAPASVTTDTPAPQEPHASRPPRTPLQQLPLPGCAPTPRDRRPWPAKRSLFTWGRQVVADTAIRTQTPAQCWVFPDWNTPTWSAFCQLRQIA
jgi:hypothetical protein